MSFIIKVISFLVIITTVYILGIFLFPKETDSIADKLGIVKFNEQIRSFKAGTDSVSDTMIQMKDAESNINYARDIIDQTNQKIDETKNTVEQKIDQTQKVIESGEKVVNSAKELKQNVDTLTTVSGSNK